MEETRAVLRRILEDAPGSIRAIAREADVSHALLVAIRDGDRRLTPRTREALTAALRRWADRCERLAEDLESAGTSNGEDEDG